MTWRERGNEYRQVESFWGNIEKRKREKEQDIVKREIKTKKRGKRKEKRKETERM